MFGDFNGMVIIILSFSFKYYNSCNFVIFTQNVRNGFLKFKICQICQICLIPDDGKIDTILACWALFTVICSFTPNPLKVVCVQIGYLI